MIRIFRKNAEADGLNVESMTEWYAAFGFEVLAVDGAGRKAADRTGRGPRECRGCHETKPGEQFAQYVLPSGRKGRRSPYCQTCEEETPREERERLVRRAWKEQNGDQRNTTRGDAPRAGQDRQCRECQTVQPIAEFACSGGQYFVHCRTCRTTPVRECETCAGRFPMTEFAFVKPGVRPDHTRRVSGIVSRNCRSCREFSPQAKAWATRKARQQSETPGNTGPGKV